MWKRKWETGYGKQNLAGVKVDEDFRRYYPFGTLASKVLGFTGSDNQGIIGLEVFYDSVLAGKNGQILTLTTPGVWSFRTPEKAERSRKREMIW